MSTLTRFLIYLAVLLFAFLAAVWHYRRQALSLKMIALMLGFTILSEMAAAYAAWKYHNNMPVYHIYTPVSVILVALFYHYFIPFFRRYHIALWMAVVSIAAALVNTVYLQPLTVLDTYAILFSGELIIAMTLAALFYIAGNDSIVRLTRSPYFWLSWLFLFYWCTNFFIWASIEVLRDTEDHSALIPLYRAIWIANLLFYTGTGFVFVFITPRKKTAS